MTVHDFQEYLQRGEDAESVLDEHFHAEYGCEITKATDIEQLHMGIDRWFVMPSGRRVSIEYKADYEASKTGRGFIETGHLGPRKEKRGWVYLCRAQHIMFYVPGSSEIYVLNPKTVQQNVSTWLRKYKARAAENDAYWTYGVAVPLTALRSVAQKVLTVSPRHAA